MKMQSAHYQNLKFIISKLDRDAVLAHKAQVHAKRYVWAVFFAAINNSSDGVWFSDELYRYLDDTHINTALSRIIIELEL